MAIDDNKVYGLTGAQLKELPGKIEAVKGAAYELTSADYDWPTSNPDGIALWKLPAGWYYVPTPSNPLKVYTSNGYSETAYTGLFSISQIQDKKLIGKWVDDLGNFGAVFRRTDGAGGGAIDPSWNNFYLLGNTSIVDDLTTSSSTKVLSAKQGKTLKGLIDSLDTDLQSQIDAIVASSDVKDIVGTKADLNNYDTSTLGDKDIIKVLADESQSNATTYYRWSVSGAAFTLIGSEGPYYTKSQTDTLVNAKADASTTYTKSEVDTALNGKVDNATLSNYATTAAMNTALAGKADAPAAGTTYVTDAAMTTALATKADASTTYTKQQVDVALFDKQDVINSSNKISADWISNTNTDNKTYQARTTAPTTSTVGTIGELYTDGTTGKVYVCTDDTGGTYTWNEVSAAVNRTVYTDCATPTRTTSQVVLTFEATNLADGTTTTNSRILPSASTSAAGVLSAADKTKIDNMPTITMTTTDPGEGVALAANNFIAVYSA